MVSGHGFTTWHFHTVFGGVPLCRLFTWSTWPFWPISRLFDKSWLLFGIFCSVWKVDEVVHYAAFLSHPSLLWYFKRQSRWPSFFCLQSKWRISYIRFNSIKFAKKLFKNYVQCLSFIAPVKVPNLGLSQSGQSLLYFCLFVWMRELF